MLTHSSKNACFEHFVKQVKYPTRASKQKAIDSLAIHKILDEDVSHVLLASQCDSKFEDPAWMESMNKEINALNLQKCWELIERPPNVTVLQPLWIYKTKADGTLKSRLTVNGKRQEMLEDCYAAVVAKSTLRLLVKLSLMLEWELHHLDVSNAFVFGSLPETDPPVFMYQPRGFVVEGKENLVCRLKRSLYGLKNLPKIWRETLSAALGDFGMMESLSEPGVYFAREVVCWT